ncbi:hypothetical protein R1flu_016604 [Riccia fluitans]|uniref:Uncharacterized protein n=1 Tax=Riccia fluitans TaxID=41844 RepID=A0ABD1YMI5_9MARC
MGFFIAIVKFNDGNENRACNPPNQSVIHSSAYHLKGGRLGLGKTLSLRGVKISNLRLSFECGRCLGLQEYGSSGCITTFDRQVLTKIGSEVIWNCKMSTLELLLLSMLLAIGWFPTSESRNVPNIEIVPAAVSLRDRAAQAEVAVCDLECDVHGEGSRIGMDPQPHMSGSGWQTLGIGGRKLVAIYCRNDPASPPFISFDYPDPGESTPIIDPPAMAPHEIVRGHMDKNYADPGTHPPGDDDSDKPPIHDHPVRDP